MPDLSSYQNKIESIVNGIFKDINLLPDTTTIKAILTEELSDKYTLTTNVLTPVYYKNKLISSVTIPIVLNNEYGVSIKVVYADIPNTEAPSTFQWACNQASLKGCSLLTIHQKNVSHVLEHFACTELLLQLQLPVITHISNEEFKDKRTRIHQIATDIFTTIGIGRDEKVYANTLYNTLTQSKEFNVSKVKYPITYKNQTVDIESVVICDHIAVYIKALKTDSTISDKLIEARYVCDKLNVKYIMILNFNQSAKFNKVLCYTDPVVN